MHTENFLMNKINLCFNRDTFCTHHTHIYIEQQNKSTIKAYEAMLGFKQQNLISTMGEFFEREILLNANKIRKSWIPCFSLIDFEEKKIETSKIFFSNEFVDSCGMSSHTISSEGIEKAFLEFFERQSFLLNFLSKSPGKEIILGKYVTSSVNQYDNYIKNYVEEVEYFNISLSSEIYIIIAIALGEKMKGVGLGTAFNIEDAVKKAQQEVLQNFATYSSKFSYSDIGFYEDKPNKSDLYYYQFFHKTPSEIRELYSYLKNNNLEIELEPHKSKESFCLNKFVKTMYHKYSMNPFIVFVPSKRNVANLKIIKIFDFNWFPHMNPELYPNELYDFIEHATGLSLDKTIKQIPFP